MDGSSAICVVVSVVCGLAASVPLDTTEAPRDTQTLDILMKGAKPNVSDAHLCSSYSMVNMLNDTYYIVKYETIIESSLVDHLLLFGCDGDPAESTDVWVCSEVCAGGAQEQMLFAWTGAAPPFDLPKDVGFRVGRNSRISNLVLQVNYKSSFNETSTGDRSGIRIQYTPQQQKYVAGIYLMERTNITLPPNTKVIDVDVSCVYTASDPMYPFAFRTDSHSLGQVISGYVFNTSLYQIGKENPQWPEAFYPTNRSIVVKEGNEMLARCTYDSTGYKNDTDPSLRGNVCNFYIMYYIDSSVKMPYRYCEGNKFPQLVNNLLLDADAPPPESTPEAQNHTDASPPPTTTPDVDATGANNHTEAQNHTDAPPTKSTPEVGAIGGTNLTEAQNHTDVPNNGNKTEPFGGSRKWKSMKTSTTLITLALLLLVLMGAITLRIYMSNPSSCVTNLMTRFFGNSHKGFDQLSTEVDPLDDPDQLLFMRPAKKHNISENGIVSRRL